MARLAGSADAAVVYGPRGVHLETEILSWHHVNGADAEDILPAILVTTRHPRWFQERHSDPPTDALLLIPLRQICKTADDVITLVEQLFRDIKDRKNLANFTAARSMKAGVGAAFVDAVILQPNVAGLGFDVKRFFETGQVGRWMRKRSRQR
jgi:hypothetical protein